MSSWSAILRVTWLRAIKARAERCSYARGWSSRLVVAILLSAAPANAHPAPFSYLDLRLSAAGVTGTLVVHDLDAAHDRPHPGCFPARSRSGGEASLCAGGNAGAASRAAVRRTAGSITWGGIDVVPERQSVRLAFTVRNLITVHRHDSGPTRSWQPSDRPDLHQPGPGRCLSGCRRSWSASKQTVEIVAGTTKATLVVHVRHLRDRGIMIGFDQIVLDRPAPARAVRWRGWRHCHRVHVWATASRYRCALDILSRGLLYFIEPLIALTIVVVGADTVGLAVRGEDKKERTSGCGSPPGSDSSTNLNSLYGAQEFGLPQAALARS